MTTSSTQEVNQSIDKTETIKPIKTVKQPKPIVKKKTKKNKASNSKFNNSGMTLKQKRFCDEYIRTGNGTASAITAGYNPKCANSIASENLTKPIIRAYVQKRLAELDLLSMMQQKEVLQGLTKVARREEQEYVVSQETTKEEFYENIGTKEKPVMKKRSITSTVPRIVPIPARLQDTNKAYELLGKHHKLFTDNVEVTTHGVTIVNDIPDVPDDEPNSE